MKKGRVDVITGPMFAGKTEELLRRLQRHRYAGRRVAILRHPLDTRFSATEVISRSGSRSSDIPVFTDETHPWFVNCDVIGIEEAQFYPKGILRLIIRRNVEAGHSLIICGLSLDATGEPFGGMPYALAVADTITSLTAVCMKCGADASRQICKQELLSGERLLGSDQYLAVCRDCT